MLPASKTKRAIDVSSILQLLESSRSYSESTKHVERIDTHISWVFLTDRHAFKLKKPVKFEFLDFSSPRLREQACREELRLNRRLAPDVYVSVVPITQQSTGGLSLGGLGEQVDWAVKMHRLPADRALDCMIKNGAVTPRDVTELATTLAEFYTKLPPLTVQVDEYRRQLTQHVQANREELGNPAYGFSSALVKRLHEVQTRLLKLAPDAFDDRVRDGRIVDGHGDLRPEHIYFAARPTIIDCIEFSDELRSLDVVDELAFLAMECDLLGAEAVGREVFAQYQDRSGDRVPTVLLAFYKIYRACVRAKVLALRAGQVGTAAEQDMLDAARRYLEQADTYRKTLGPPVLLVVHGLPGTGKSTVAKLVAESLDVDVMQTDAIRREVFGPSDLPAEFGQGKYTSAARDRVYVEMLRRAEGTLKTHRSVVLDGTFLSSQWRLQAFELARRHDAEPFFVCCECTDEVALRRIEDRLAAGHSPSETRPEFFQLQQQAEEIHPEGLPVVQVDTSKSLPDIARTIFSHLRAAVHLEEPNRFRSTSLG